jgi:hypothetical protein
MNIDKQSHTTQWLTVGSLDVRWVEAQRAFDPRWAKHIMDEFDPDMFGVLTVSIANGEGSYHVVDGQHRRWAINELYGPDEKVPCTIVQADTPAKAASIFNKMNTHRKSVDRLTTFNVRVVAEEPAETAVNRVIRECGLRAAAQMDGSSVRAVGTCMDIHRKHGETVLRDTLRLVKATWGDTASALDGIVLRGFSEMLVKHPTMNHQRAVEMMGKHYTPERLIGAAKTARETFGGTMATNMVRVFETVYNRGRKKDRLE